MIQIPIVSDFDSKGVKQAQKAFADFGKQSKSLGKSLRSITLPVLAVGGAITAVAASAVKGLIEEQKAQAELARQLRQTTNATDAQISATERYLDATELATGVNVDDLRPSLTALVRATGSLTKGQKALRVAMDVAAATGKPLNRVVESMARAYGGNVKALARLDPSLKSFITKTTTADQAIAKMASSFRGASDAAANTLQGRMDRLSLAFGQIRDQLVEGLVPIVEKFADVLTNKVAPYGQKVADTFSEKGLGGVMKMLGKDIFNAWQNADGFAGALVELATVAGIFFAVFKGVTLVTTLVATLKAAAAAVGSLGGAFSIFAGATTATITAAFAAIVLTVGLLVSSLRDLEMRKAWGELLANSAKLVANAFVLLYKVVQGALNPIISLINKAIPGKGNDIKLLPDVNFEKFTSDANKFQFDSPRRFESSPANNVTINVSGGDPNAVVDALTKWYRQNGPLPVAARG